MSVNQGIGTVLGTSKTVNPLLTTTYTLTASNITGTDTKSLTVTVHLPTAPAPTFSLPGGDYIGDQIITLTNTLAGSSIYYTTDGTAPTPASPLYVGPITLPTSATVRAITVKDGYNTSPIAATTYSITPLPTETLFTYDKNGNLLQESGRTNALYTWDSNNRMQSSTRTNHDGTQVISHYLYDTGGQRIYEKVIKKSGTTVTDTRETYYPSNQYSESYDGTNALTKRTEHIFAGDLMIATVEYVPVNQVIPVNPVKYYHLTDHLSSTQVTTDQSGTVTELNDYYAFGNPRQNIRSEAFSEQRKYIGEVFDADTGLNYLNARYFNAQY